MKQLGIEVEATFTQKRPDGSYKKIRMATAASLEEGDDPSGCRRVLFEDLSEDLKACFNSKTPPPKPDYPQLPISKGSKTGKGRKKGNPGKPKTKICPIHACEMTQRENSNTKGKFWSHRLPDGSWCNGKQKKRGK